MIKLPEIKLIHGDSEVYIQDFQNNQFDLGIIDPPYGLGDKLTKGGTWAKKYTSKDSDWDGTDKMPSDNFFQHFFRVTKNQIIWGGNYFNLPPNRCFIIWDKMIRLHTMAHCDYAWTSFDSPPVIFRHIMDRTNRKIIGQKPVALYKHCLKRFSQPGEDILDTHLGSGGISVACWDYRCNLTGIEKKLEHFKEAHKRFLLHKSQQQAF